jgi:flagellar capping protein FliD
MIKGFEEFTGELSEYEEEFILPVVHEFLCAAIGKDRAITNKEMVQQLKFVDLKTSGPRVRHIIHILRVSDTISQLIATSDGYYITNDPDELKNYLDSLDERIKHISKVRHAINRQLLSFKVVKSGELQGHFNF